MQLCEISCTTVSLIVFNGQRTNVSVPIQHRIDPVCGRVHGRESKFPNMMPAKSDSRRRLNATGVSTADYSKVDEGITETDGFVNEQWIAPTAAEPTPWRTIIIILALFLGGTICICCAALDWIEETNEDRIDRIVALSIIGALTIIPGGYYLFVLVCILLHRNGYTMDDIRRLG